MRRFRLKKEQIKFLKTTYPDNELVRRVLDCENDTLIEVDIDTKIDLMEFLEDESVYWMNESQEGTSKTHMIESIRDDIYYQTN